MTDRIIADLPGGWRGIVHDLAVTLGLAEPTPGSKKQHRNGRQASERKRIRHRQLGSAVLLPEAEQAQTAAMMPAGERQAYLDSLPPVTQEMRTAPTTGQARRKSRTGKPEPN